MERTSFRNQPCPIARSLDVLGDWWTPLLIREALYGKSRFDDFQRSLAIGRHMLSKRLSLLVDEGLLSKNQYQDNPPRHEYRLTDKGYDAARVLVALMPFGERWFFRNRAPIRLFHRRTGAPVQPVLVDANTGEALDPRDLYAGPGPAFPKDPELRKRRFTEYYARRQSRAGTEAAS